MLKDINESRTPDRVWWKKEMKEKDGEKDGEIFLPVKNHSLKLQSIRVFRNTIPAVKYLLEIDEKPSPPNSSENKTGFFPANHVVRLVDSDGTVRWLIDNLKKERRKEKKERERRKEKKLQFNCQIFFFFYQRWFSNLRYFFFFFTLEIDNNGGKCWNNCWTINREQLFKQSSGLQNSSRDTILFIYSFCNNKDIARDFYFIIWANLFWILSPQS